MSIFKSNLEISIFGESHGKVMGITIHNFPSGIKLNLDHIKESLALRVDNKIGLSKRVEEDKFEVVSGYFNSYTTGAPLTILLYNEDFDSNEYIKNYGKARPSHADYTAFVKYNGFNDYRGGGHLSGRITALYMILGSICQDELDKKGIKVVSRIKQIADVIDNSIFEKNSIKDKTMPVIDSIVKKQMIERIENVENDSLGGIVETNVVGVKEGLGDPLFNSVESMISHLIFSIPAVKGIEFGEGFNFCNLFGSEASDQMRYNDNKVTFLTNHNGGVLGGITNGEIINFKTVIKPTPSINLSLQSIDFINKENCNVITKGRHDKCIVLKAVHVINALTSFAIYDLIQGNK